MCTWRCRCKHVLGIEEVNTVESESITDELGRLENLSPSSY